MSAGSIVAVVTAAVGLIGAVTALIHAIGTRRMIRGHTQSPKAHA